MNQVLKDINDGKYKGMPPSKFTLLPKIVIRPKLTQENKKKWYKIGKVVIKSFKIKMCSEGKLAAKRTYLFYNIGKGDWEGPSPR